MDGMRVRVRLDQQRISSLLAGISPKTMGGQFADVASGVLSMLGDMASLSFARYHTGVASVPLSRIQLPYLLCTSAVYFCCRCLLSISAVSSICAAYICCVVA